MLCEVKDTCILMVKLRTKRSDALAINPALQNTVMSSQRRQKRPTKCCQNAPDYATDSPQKGVFEATSCDSDAKSKRRLGRECVLATT